MELKDIAVISGKGGLFKILKPTRTGVIVESIDEKKTRFPVSTNNRISVLEEISLYTKTSDGSTPIKHVLRKIYEEFNSDPGVTANSDPEELKSFFQHIEPEYDEEKVYVSDMKKIISWYFIIYKNFPEILSAKEESKEEQETKEEKPSQEVKEVKEVKKEKEEKEETAKSKSETKKESTSEEKTTSKTGSKAKSK